MFGIRMCRSFLIYEFNMQISFIKCLFVFCFKPGKIIGFGFVAFGSNQKESPVAVPAFVGNVSASFPIICVSLSWHISLSIPILWHF